MSEWREQILRRFVPKVARVTAVSDPDGLLRDPELCQAIEAKGFAIVQFEDPITFRYDYESRFRSKWDNGSDIELVVVFKPGDHDFETLPADVLADAQRLSFSLKDLFQKLSYNVISKLDTIYFDSLYRAQKQHASQPHDELQTRGFVLRHIFGIEPTVIRSVPDLLRMLCHRHYSKVSIPALLDAHLIACLRDNPTFSQWPLESIVPNRSDFWAFLDERWPIFLQNTKGGTMVLREGATKLKYPGPEILPFDHDDVRIYIDNLFEDGILTPIQWDWSQASEKTWIRVGLLGTDSENTDLRFNELIRSLGKEHPSANSTPQDWLTFAYRYAQASFLWNQIGTSVRSEHQKAFSDLRDIINRDFLAWLMARYGGLYNYPASSPLMVNHIPGFIAHQILATPKKCAAFILVDGLALDQWLILKDSLRSSGMSSTIEENALFAWIPTLTPISRQAAFAGKIPRYFAETVDRTNQDENRWRQFWADRGLAGDQVGFCSVDGEPSDIESVENAIHPHTCVIGCTVTKVDEIMHGMRLGSMGMAGQVRTWAEQRFLLTLIDTLRVRGFDIFISSDHGNTEAIGIGRPQEGVLSDTRGQRCRIYPEPALRKRCLAEFPETHAWNHAGLPENLCTILSAYGDAFAKDGTTVLAHGGPSLEEVCVPFIHIPSPRS